MKTPDFKTVDEYIAQFPAETQDKLKQMRSVILANAPGVTELISYQMPAYKLNGVLVYFAGYQHHIGFYATPAANNAFITDLSKYKMGKGSIQFPLNEPLPSELIARMVKFKVDENLQKRENKKKQKR